MALSTVSTVTLGYGFQKSRESRFVGGAVFRAIDCHQNLKTERMSGEANRGVLELVMHAGSHAAAIDLAGYHGGQHFVERPVLARSVHRIKILHQHVM